MSAETLLKFGDLDGALSELQSEIRKQPARADLRVFLFQLQCLKGDWKKAGNQLNVQSDLDPTTQPMVTTYGAALQCEILRAQVFAGKTLPMVLGEPAPWMGLLLESAKLFGQGEFERSASLREKAFEDAPMSGGTIDGQPFEWLADADSRFGPTFEAIVNGRYYWISFDQITSIEAEGVSDLRDIAWVPSTITVKNGGQFVALLPGLYPGSAHSDDTRIAMGRLTTWTDRPGDAAQGLGQRIWATDGGEYPLFGVRKVSFG